MLKFKSVVLGAFLLSLVGCDSNQNIDQAAEISAIESVLNYQKDAWNHADIELYMSGYWPSDSLVFTGGNKITHGWRQATQRYKKSYPDKTAMGRLEFSDLKTTLISELSAFTTGSWQVNTDSNSAQGRFTLVWKKIDNQWLIIADHSS